MSDHPRWNDVWVSSCRGVIGRSGQAGLRTLNGMHPSRGIEPELSLHAGLHHRGDEALELRGRSTGSRSTAVSLPLLGSSDNAIRRVLRCGPVPIVGRQHARSNAMPDYRMGIDFHQVIEFRAIGQLQQ